MGSASFSFGDGEWFPLFGPKIDDESPVERAQRLAHLREAKQRQAERFRCEDCGELGAMEPPNDRYHVEHCPARKRTCTECGARYPTTLPEGCPLCGTPVYIRTLDSTCAACDALRLREGRSHQIGQPCDICAGRGDIAAQGSRSLGHSTGGNQ